MFAYALTRRLCRSPAGVLALFCVVSGGSALAETPSFSLPVSCALGRTCFIQSYVDVVRGPERRDYACGNATYDAHKGTDFRLVSADALPAGAGVFAAAAGKVKARRDGMADRLYRPKDAKDISGRECGNGVVIEHGAGWTTQYCHMRRGSVRVKVGEDIARGAVLGKVGYSGKAQFAHLHFQVSLNGQIIDPFAGIAPARSCAGGEHRGGLAASLWRSDLHAALAYRTGEIIEAAFVSTKPDKSALELGRRNGGAISATSQALVFFARAIKLQKGDSLRLIVTGPDGFTARHRIKPVDRAKALWLAFTGRRLRKRRWPAGRYEGRAELMRAGRTLRRAGVFMVIE